MNNVIVNNVEVSLVAHDGAWYTTSLDVSRVFRKRHNNVLDKIRKFGKEALLNFKQGYYFDANNQSRPMYEMNRDGLIFLISKFYGEKAERLLAEYISQFNSMERALSSPSVEVALPSSNNVAVLEAIMSMAKISIEQDGRISELERRMNEQVLIPNIENLSATVVDIVSNHDFVVKPKYGYESKNTLRKRFKLASDRITELADVFQVRRDDSPVGVNPDTGVPVPYCAYNVQDMEYAIRELKKDMTPTKSGKQYNSKYITGSFKWL